MQKRRKRLKANQNGKRGKQRAPRRSADNEPNKKARFREPFLFGV